MSEQKTHHHHSHHHHSHHHHRHRLSKKQRGLIWGIVLLVCVAAIAGFAILVNRAEKSSGTQTYGDLEERFAPVVTLEQNGTKFGYRNGRLTNILVIGIDQRDINQTRTGFRNGGQADFLLLLSIDRENRRITPIQLDRDTITGVEMLGVLGHPAGIRQTHLSVAQVFGRTREQNCENTVRAVRRLLYDVPITYYLALDMAGITDLNDALDGVTVTVGEDLTNLDPALKAGARVTLRGQQAETYVRSRMAVISDPTNAGRMRRQRTYMAAAVERFTSLASKDLSFIDEFMEKMQDHIVTDVPQSWLTSHLQSYLQYERADICVPSGVHQDSTDGFTEFYPDEEALKKMVIEIFFEKANRS